MTGSTPALRAYLAECCVCDFSLRLADGLVGVDAEHIRWRTHGGLDEVPNGLAPCALHHRPFDHGVLTALEDHRLRVATALSGTSARELLEGLDGRPVRLPVERGLRPGPVHLRWHPHPGLPRPALISPAGTAPRRVGADAGPSGREGGGTDDRS